MSEVAGRLSVHVGLIFAHCLRRAGRIIRRRARRKPGQSDYFRWRRGGVNAAQMAVGLHADVTLFDISAHKLIEINQMFNGRVKLPLAPMPL